MIYVHFTNLKDAVAIKKSGVLWKSSYIEGIFAVAKGGFSSPGVQQSKLGRVSNRNVAVVFKTEVLPDAAFPEEVVWHDLEDIPIKVISIVNLDQLERSGFLDESLPIDPEFDQLSIPLHPAFSWVFQRETGQECQKEPSRGSREETMRNTKRLTPCLQRKPQ